MNQGFGSWSQPNVPLAAVMSQLSADFTMTNANQYYDLLTVTVPAGTWLLIGALSFAGAAGACTAKIHDGINPVASTHQRLISGSSEWHIAVTGLATCTGPTTYRLAAADTGAGNIVKAAAASNAAGNTASTLVAFPLQPPPR